MSNFKLYNRVLSALNEDEGTFNAAARNWVEGAETVSFEDAEANELFSEAKMHCLRWRSKAINGRVSKHRMVECIRKIAEKNLSNPYPEETEEPKEEIKEEPKEILQEEQKKEQQELPQETIHVLGVVPEETVQEYSVQVSEEPVQIPETVVSEEVVGEKQPKKEERHLFERRKRR